MLELDRSLPALLLILALTAPSSCQEHEPGTESAAPEDVLLEVRALANEGFLLSVGDTAVAIDAFVSEPFSGYAALAGEPLEALLAGKGPFASVDLALVSHAHGDHFQPEPARSFLAARPECVFVSSPQVVDLLAEPADPGDPHGEQPHSSKTRQAYLPADGEQQQLQLGKIQVTLLRLSHGTGRFAKMQNLGHVITIAGVSALHVGDAAMVPMNFAAYDLPQRGLDVVFVPYWYFDVPAGRTIVAQHFQPARLVACHIPPSELAAVTERLAKSFPEVIVPQRQMQLLRFRDENPAR